MIKDIHRHHQTVCLFIYWRSWAGGSSWFKSWFKDPLLEKEGILPGEETNKRFAVACLMLIVVATYMANFLWSSARNISAKITTFCLEAKTVAHAEIYAQKIKNATQSSITPILNIASFTHTNLSFLKGIPNCCHGESLREVTCSSKWMV